ncbi:MAG: hypothetical protein HY686_09170 [Chloroflexi bacterium]|nr:hypothetical protein [Chloroflexota bacterium]
MATMLLVIAPDQPIPGPGDEEAKQAMGVTGQRLATEHVKALYAGPGEGPLGVARALAQRLSLEPQTLEGLGRDDPSAQGGLGVAPGASGSPLTVLREAVSRQPGGTVALVVDSPLGQALLLAIAGLRDGRPRFLLEPYSVTSLELSGERIVITGSNDRCHLTGAMP